MLFYTHFYIHTFTWDKTDIEKETKYLISLFVYGQSGWIILFNVVQFQPAWTHFFVPAIKGNPQTKHHIRHLQTNKCVSP